MADAESWWAGARWRTYEHACQVVTPRTVELAQAGWRTRVVDLRPNEGQLWSDVRKSYRQSIEKAKLTHRFVRTDCVASFQKLHEAAAQRATRPPQSWDMMAQWERDGFLLVVGAAPLHGRGHYGGWDGFVGFERWNHWAYYGHAATLVRGLGHALVWHAMAILKHEGVTRLEMGWQGEARTEKGLDVEFFRTGFGGVDVPANEGEAQWP